MLIPQVAQRGTAIEGLTVDGFARTMLDRTVAELAEERAAVQDLLKG